MAGMKSTEQAAELRRKEQEYLSMVHIKQVTKECPKCGAWISRTEGCNKVSCLLGWSAQALLCSKCQCQLQHFLPCTCKAARRWAAPLARLLGLCSVRGGV